MALLTKGKQVVDTPEWMVKTGVIWKAGGFEISPRIRMTGKRFGDAENREKVNAFVVADLGISYTIKKALGLEQIKASLDINNITSSHPETLTI